jgi:hypothetical protein
MIRLRRRNTAWLAVMAILTALGMMAAGQVLAVPLAVQFTLLAIFALAAIASTVELGRERETLMDALRRVPMRQRVSPQAKEASERARSHGGFVNNDLLMLDVGLIAVQSSYEGMAMRRTRSISKDDDGARPFVTLYVDPAEAERNAVIRFEIYNQHGDEQFVHEMKVFLREGEMNIMTDHHLPLAGNRDITGAGDWDLRVYVDGNLVGLHNFMLAPSMTERQRRLTGEAEFSADEKYHNFEIIDEVQQEIPPRLQDLLQNQPSKPATSKSSTSVSAPAAPPNNAESGPQTGTITRSRRRGTTRR